MSTCRTTPQSAAVVPITKHRTRRLPKRLHTVHDLTMKYGKVYDAAFSHEMEQVVAVLTEYLAQPYNLRMEYERDYVGTDYER